MSLGYKQMFKVHLYCTQANAKAMLLSNRLFRNSKCFLPSANKVREGIVLSHVRLSVCSQETYLKLVTWEPPPTPPNLFPLSNSSIENFAFAYCKCTLTIIDDDVILVAVAVHPEIDEVEFDPEPLGSSDCPPALQVPVVTAEK